ncbi:MAG: pyridoxamine 5'-phosphate oxidase family protein, partial [Planctomycetes bacterium]|nr:pyridoxamine 5'-phosphate oxidase family protein [Planctomycetota bacterium]
MRKTEREIKDHAAKVAVLEKAEICHLALTDGKTPYVVPLNFGYKDDALYFHAAPEGRKIDLIEKNDNVCFLCYADLELVRTKKACGWTMHYQSVIGFGKARIITDPGAKKAGLDLLMSHYGDPPFSYAEGVVDKMVIIEVKIESLTG